MDKASSVLESLAVPSPQLPAGYQRLFATADCPPTDHKFGLHTSLVQSPLPEPGSTQLVPDQPVVGDRVSSSLPPVDQLVLDDSHKQVLHVSSDSPKSDNDPLILVDSEGPSSVSFEQRGNHTIPPPRN